MRKLLDGARPERQPARSVSRRPHPVGERERFPVQGIGLRTASACAQRLGCSETPGEGKEGHTTARSAQPATNERIVRLVSGGSSGARGVQKREEQIARDLKRRRDRADRRPARCGAVDEPVEASTHRLKSRCGSSKSHELDPRVDVRCMASPPRATGPTDSPSPPDGRPRRPCADLAPRASATARPVREPAGVKPRCRYGYSSSRSVEGPCRLAARMRWRECIRTQIWASGGPALAGPTRGWAPTPTTDRQAVWTDSVA